MTDYETMFEDSVLQRSWFRHPSSRIPREVYVIAEDRTTLTTTRDEARCAPFASFSLDTYFGRFPASYWQRWTDVHTVEARFTYTGEAVMRQMASDSTGGERLVDEVRLEKADEPRKIAVAFPLDAFLDGGHLWLEFDATESGLVVRDVAWTTEQAPLRGSSVSIAICTFNRSRDCARNLVTVAESLGSLPMVDRIVVVDQGTHHVEDEPDFATAAGILGDRLVYVQQANLGGAGGFSRGMHEIVGRGESTHVLLMDDDVLVETETIRRLATFAEHTFEPVLVGAQMLDLLHPTVLHVSAEQVEFSRLRAGQPTRNSLAREDMTAERGDARADASYNAWWSCLIPAEVVLRSGYALPYFFQWDDIEFGLRCADMGVATVTLPGAAVWHAPFTHKDWDDWSRYFSFRNSLITAALHSELTPAGVSTAIGMYYAKHMVVMQYGLVATLLTAVEDFLSGPQCLADGGPAAMTRIRQIRAAYPDTRVEEPTAIRQVKLLSAEKQERLRKKPMLAPLAAGSLILRQLLSPVPSRPQIGTAAADDAYWWFLGRLDAAVVTDASREGFRIRRRDPELARSLAKRGGTLLGRLAAEYPAVRQAYLEAAPDLRSRENWKRLFSS